MQKIKEFLKHWKLIEIIILFGGIIAVTITFILGPEKSVLAYIVSLMSVISTMVIAKGFAIAPLFDLLPTTLYVFVAVFQKFYGEVIIYIAMLIPIGIFTVIKWLTHRDDKYKEFVSINKITKKETFFIFVIGVFLWIVTYFILMLLGSSELIANTFCLVLCTIACYLMYRRSPYYSIVYIAYDITAMVMWISTISANGTKYMPTIISCLFFLISDIYGFYWWKVCEKKQLNRRSQKQNNN